MSKKRKHKHRKNHDTLGIDHDIQLYKNRSVELCHQYESATNIQTQRAIRAQYESVCTIINDLMADKRLLTSKL